MRFRSIFRVTAGSVGRGVERPAQLELAGGTMRNGRFLAGFLGKVVGVARAGLHLGVSTAGRMLKECGSKGPKIEANVVDGKSVREKGKENPGEADYPNHVWQDIRIFLGRVVTQNNASPKYLVSVKRGAVRQPEFQGMV